MEKYSIVTINTAPHVLLDTLLRSIRKHLHPDEIIVIDHYFKYSKRGGHHGEGLNKGIKAARNNNILILDNDIIITDTNIEQLALDAIKDPNTYCAGFWTYIFDKKTQKAKDIVLPHAIMIKKDMYYKNGVLFNNGGNPSYAPCSHALSLGQKTIKIDADKYIFHLGGGCKTHFRYPHIVTKLQQKWNEWKDDTGSTAQLSDYFVDDGMNLNDHDWLCYMILDELNTSIQKQEPFSLLRLGDLGIRYLYDYVFDPRDFTHVGKNHPDIAMPNDEVGRKLIGELIPNMKKANWIDHGFMYKGAMQPLYNWRKTGTRANELFKKLDIQNTKYCCPLQANLSFIKNFELTMYDILKHRKVLYVGPYPTFDDLMSRKKIDLEDKGYYRLSMSHDHNRRYQVMEAFMSSVDVNYWDLILVTGSLYGRTLIGRIRNEGGRAFDMGQAIHFNPNNIFETVVRPVDNKTYYEVINHLDTDIYNLYKDTAIKIVQL